MNLSLTYISVSSASEDHIGSHDDRGAEDGGFGVTVTGVDQSTRDWSPSQASETDCKC